MTSDEDRKGKDRDETEKSERKLSTLLSNIPGMVYRCKNDKDWTMEYLSEGCKDLTGYDPSELIDNDKVSWAEVIHSEHREKVREEIQESIKKEEPFTFNYKISTKNGGEKTLWELGRPVLDSEGNVEALEGFMTDITDKVESKKRAEERVEKAKRLYKAAIELERCKTKQEVYEHALESAEDILGFYTCGILIEDEGELVVKGKTEKSALEIGDRFSADEIFPGQVLKTGEASLVRDVSERNDVEASMDILNSGLDVPIGEIGVLLTASDEVGYYDDFDLEMAKILAAHIDKTVKRIEEEKEKSLVLDTTEELVVYQDADQKINWVNRVAAETVDKAPEELKGKKCYEVWGTGDELCEGCPVKKTIDTGTGQEGERKDEEGNHWLIRASPEKNEEGEVVGVVEVALDITKRKEAEERLKENKEKIERLFESTSHMQKIQDMDRIYEEGINAVENILGIDMGSIFVSVGDKLVLKAETSGVPPHDIQFRDKEEDVAGKTFKTKDPDITDDLRESEEANPHFDGYRSGITVPISDFGIFQAMSEEVGYFDKTDLNMLRLLAHHISEARRRIKLRKDLEESEKRYRTIFENTGTGMAMIEEDDTISLVNEELEKLSGYSKEEIEGKMEWTEFIVDEDLERMIENKKKRMEGNIEDVPRRYAFKGVNRFGDVRDFIGKVGRIPDSYKILVSLIDISEQKKTFGKMRESQEAFWTLFQYNNDPVVLVNEDGTIKEVNSKFIEVFDESEKELIGVELKNFIHQDSTEEFVIKMDEIICGEIDSVELDLNFGCVEGENIPLEIDLNPVRDNKDDLIYLIGIIHLENRES